MIAVRLVIWKNIMDKERTLKTLQDSVAWIRKPFHHSTASATRITTWQATWRPKSIQHFLKNLYFFSCLKQLSSSSPLKKIAAKSSTNIKRRVGMAKDMMRERNLPLLGSCGWVELYWRVSWEHTFILSASGRAEGGLSKNKKHRSGYPTMILILRFWFVRNKRIKRLRGAKSTAFYEKCEIPLSER